MSVLIKGLTMPKNSYEVKTIAIRSDGTWYEMTIRGDYDYESGEAVEVPTPHGRLIDTNTKIKVSKGTGLEYLMGEIKEEDHTIEYVLEYCNLEVPTVIEAEVEE